MKLYGPYTRPDGRKFVCLVNDGVNKTMSWPRYLMQEFLGRELLPEETVDHINNDFTDDKLENLQILSRADNARKEMQRPHRVQKLGSYICEVCGCEFTRKIATVKHNRNQGKAGPFCGRSCAGRYSTMPP